MRRAKENITATISAANARKSEEVTPSAAWLAAACPHLVCPSGIFRANSAGWRDFTVERAFGTRCAGESEFKLGDNRSLFTPSSHQFRTPVWGRVYIGTDGRGSSTVYRLMQSQARGRIDGSCRLFNPFSAPAVSIGAPAPAQSGQRRRPITPSKLGNLRIIVDA